LIEHQVQHCCGSSWSLATTTTITGVCRTPCNMQRLRCQWSDEWYARCWEALSNHAIWFTTVG